ncbi:MAG: Uma2 family endonuclease, partial [Halochromatium sp.]
ETGPIAPDVFVVFGRPKGRRGSYRQWEEDDIAPQVVFEILSPSNSAKEMADKLAFYDRYGVEEYYVYDPDRNSLGIWIRQGGEPSRPDTRDTRPALAPQSHIHGWTSPRLQVRFTLTPETLLLRDPNGQPFLTSVELAQRAEKASVRAEQEAMRAEQEAARADAEHTRAERLADRLRALGIDPD